MTTEHEHRFLLGPRHSPPASAMPSADSSNKASQSNRSWPAMPVAPTDPGEDEAEPTTEPEQAPAA
jgi:hypothetical protein